MCGRFALEANEDQIKSHFKITQGLSMRSRYNIAPSLTIPIIKGPLAHLEFARWGFIPSWAKIEEDAKGHINARLETLASKPTFRSAYAKGRCLIPASGYFEWQTFGDKKQPYYIHLKNQPLLAFAGLWSSHETCAIITMDAPDFLSKLHDRMPVIIHPSSYDDWLNESPLADPTPYLMPLDPQMIEYYPVTMRMNNPRFEGRECIQSL